MTLFTRADGTVDSRGLCWEEIKRRRMDVQLVFSTETPPVLVVLFMGKWSRRKGALRTIPPPMQGVTQLSYQEEVEREATQVREAMEGIQSLGKGVVLTPIMALVAPRRSQNSSSRKPAPTPRVAEKRFRKALRDLSAASILVGMQKGLRNMINSVKTKRK
jgi:hypothetical protein